MDRAEHVGPKFPADAFAGTADYYVRYRPPYPGGLLTDLIHRSGITGEGNLLDLACGPGRVALAIGSSFREIWAIDLEPEMIEAGRREAARRRVRNVNWMVGRAEELEAPAASFELITIGEAFHRLDQPLVAVLALRWLGAGCHLATLGNYSVLNGTGPWQRIVVDTVNRWTGRVFPIPGDSGPSKPDGGPDHYERVLRESGFAEVASHRFVEAHEWTIETILGYLHSTSVCSKRLLGDKAEAFEADLKAALLNYEPAGTYHEDIQWGYTLGRKPG